MSQSLRDNHWRSSAEAASSSESWLFRPHHEYSEMEIRTQTVKWEWGDQVSEKQAGQRGKLNAFPFSDDDEVASKCAMWLRN